MLIKQVQISLSDLAPEIQQAIFKQAIKELQSGLERTHSHEILAGFAKVQIALKVSEGYLH